MLGQADEVRLPPFTLPPGIGHWALGIGHFTLLPSNYQVII